MVLNHGRCALESLKDINPILQNSEVQGMTSNPIFQTEALVEYHVRTLCAPRGHDRLTPTTPKTPNAHREALTLAPVKTSLKGETSNSRVKSSFYSRSSKTSTHHAGIINIIIIIIIVIIIIILIIILRTTPKPSTLNPQPPTLNPQPTASLHTPELRKRP